MHQENFRSINKLHCQVIQTSMHNSPKIPYSLLASILEHIHAQPIANTAQKLQNWCTNSLLYCYQPQETHLMASMHRQYELWHLLHLNDNFSSLPMLSNSSHNIFSLLLGKAAHPRFSSSTCSRGEPKGETGKRYSQAGVLPLTQPTVSNHWRNTNHCPTPVTWPCPFSFHQ